MTNLPISADLIAPELIQDANTRLMPALEEDYHALGRTLARGGVDVDAVKTRVAGLGAAARALPNSLWPASRPISTRSWRIAPSSTS